MQYRGENGRISLEKIGATDGYEMVIGRTSL